MLTCDVCDTCWGTGDAHRKGADLRRLRAEIERLRASLAAARRDALEEAALLVEWHAKDRRKHEYIAADIRKLIDHAPATAEEKP